MIFYSQRTFSKAIPYSNLYHMTQLHGASWLLTRNISTRTPRIAIFVILGVPKRTMNEIPNAYPWNFSILQAPALMACLLPRPSVEAPPQAKPASSRAIVHIHRLNQQLYLEPPPNYDAHAHKSTSPQDADLSPLPLSE